MFETAGEHRSSRTLRSRFFRLGLLQVVAVVVFFVLAASGAAAANYLGSHAGALRGAELQANQLLVDTLDEEVVLTDRYALTADPADAQRYAEARAATAAALDALQGGTAGSTRSGLVRAAASAVVAWQGWAEGLRQRVLTSGPVHPGAPDLSGGDGLLAAVESALSALAGALESDYQAALDLATGTGVAVEVLATLGNATVVLLLVLLLRRMYLLALQPVGELATAAGTIAAGGRAQIPHIRRDDEIGVLSKALREWEAATREREAYLAEQRRQTERAARIQRDLWPHAKPGLERYQVAGACRPAEDVAGDLFDWQERPNGQLDLTVADVMGKGIGAALVMASLRAGLRAAPESLGPAERLETAASSITLGSDDEGLFVTVFHCRLDPDSGELRFADAGHGYCAVRRARGELVHLGDRSLPVGIQSGERFREGRITLGAGDMLVVYSDGLVERPEGTVGLEAFAEELGRAEDADDAVRRLLERTPMPQRDDATALVLRRLQTVAAAAPLTSIDEAIAGMRPEEVDLSLGGDGDARDRLDAVHRALGRFLETLAEPPSDEWRRLFALAVAEIAANIIEHARPPFLHFEVTAQGGRVTALFSDTGQGWSSPPGPAAMVDDMVERGRGLRLARTAVDEVAYERRGNTNRWRLTKQLDPS